MLAAPLLQESEGIGALGIDWLSLIAYGLNFVILAFLLYKLAYKRVIAVLDARAERIRSALEEADRVREEARAQQEALQRSLDEGRQEGQRLLAEARQAAERYREEQAARARAEAEAMLERAREEIQRERDAALEQVRAEFASLAVTAAERIIRRSLDPKAHQDLINEVLAEGVSSNGRG